MSHSFILSYGRAEGGTTYDGNLYHESDQTSYSNIPFKGLTFSRMMGMLCSSVRDAKTVGTITLKRTEVKDSSIQLGTGDIELMRTDPAAWIRGLSVPARTIHISKASKAQALSMLRTGHDTRADAFGEAVLVKRRRPATHMMDEVECPLCGRWHGVVTSTSTLSKATSVEVSCPHVGTFNKLVMVVYGGWCVVEVPHLLNIPADRYFLPRKWNTSGPWIDARDLVAKLATFKQERANVRTH